MSGGYFIEELLKSNAVNVDGLRGLLPRCRIQAYEAGHALSARGSQNLSLSFITNGLVLCGVPSVSGDTPKESTPILALTEGSWIGACDVKAAQPATLSYWAVSDVSVVEFSAELANTIMNTHAGFQEFVTRLCLEETDRYLQTLIPLKIGTMVYRVVCNLAFLAESFERGRRWRRQMNPAPGFETKSSMTLGLPQANLASLCGVSRSVLSPILRPLKQQGWLHIAYGATRICHSTAWARLAEKIRSTPQTEHDISIEWVLSELNTHKT